jgi:DNA (cytosine-5)-methyltransferase 1
VADTQQHSNSAQEQAADHRQSQTDRPTDWLGGRGVSLSGLAHSDNDRSQSRRARPEAARHGHTADADGSAERLANAVDSSRQPSVERSAFGLVSSSAGALQAAPRPTGPTNGFWRDADWLFCRDGKWRPVEPGTFPLAHGAASRVVRLCAYGNAINAEAAQAFIESWCEARVVIQEGMEV